MRGRVGPTLEPGTRCNATWQYQTIPLLLETHSSVLTTEPCSIFRQHFTMVYHVYYCTKWKLRFPFYFIFSFYLSFLPSFYPLFSFLSSPPFLTHPLFSLPACTLFFSVLSLSSLLSLPSHLLKHTASQAEQENDRYPGLILAAA